MPKVNEKESKIIVCAKRKTPRYRCGRCFTDIPQELSLSEFTSEEIAALKKDPVLLVIIT